MMKKTLKVLSFIAAFMFPVHAMANPLMDPNGVYNGQDYVYARDYRGDSVRTRHARAKHVHRPVAPKPSREPVAKLPAAEKTRYSISPSGFAFIKAREGLVTYIYDDLRESAGEWKCKKPVGTLTIGYGHTAVARGKFDFKCGARIDDLRAEDLLRDDLSEIEDQVNDALERPVTQGQYDALVSITFNCGSNGLRPVVSRVNVGNNNAAGQTLRSICRTSKGRVLRGLVDRRNAEYAMWNAPEPVTAVTSVGVVAVEAPLNIINVFRRYLGKNPTKRRTLWCADAQNKVLEDAGYKGTGSSAASSFKNYGRAGTGSPGDIALLQFGRTDNFADHVGTVTGRCDRYRIKLISGNDGGTTRERCVSEKFVVSYRTVAEPVYASLP